MSNLMKGALMIGGAAICGAAALACCPILTVSAPLWGLLGTTYSVSAIGAAGAGCGLALGTAFGRVSGETGAALVIQGLSEASEKLLQEIDS